MNEHITNEIRIIEQISRFASFVQYMNGHPGLISFRDSAGFLGREEDFKAQVAEEARKELQYGSWKESWIGTRKIAELSKKAMNKAGNLVNMNQQVDFKNRLNPDHPSYRKNAERVLYDIYCNPSCDVSVAFQNAIDVFGAKYDTIAFLFFVKDDTRFLPISPGHFDKSFALLGIDYSTSYQCGWENYQGFINIISDLRNLLEETLPMAGTPRLLDAHSFAWIIQQERFIEWEPDAEQIVQIEQDTEEYVNNVIYGAGGKRKILSSAFKRSIEVSNATRKRANGICQLCNQSAPFLDKKGNPYLEVHHVIWLSRGGEDSTSNTVALCPNCHKRMHVLDNKEDVMKLKTFLKNNCSKARKDNQNEEICCCDSNRMDHEML